MISIQNEIDTYLAEQRDNQPPRSAISASNLGSCIRKLLLAHKGYEPIPFEARTLRVFEAGNLFEDFALNILEKKNMIAYRQLAVEYRGITGTLDAVLIDPDTGELILIDTKSVHSKKFHYLNAKLDENYAMQLSLYWLGLQKAIKTPNKGIRKLILDVAEKLKSVPRLVYISKDDLCIKEIGVPVNGWKAKIDTKIDLIEKWKDKEELPPPKEERNWECFSGKGSATKCWCKYILSCSRYQEYLANGGKELE